MELSIAERLKKLSSRGVAALSGLAIAAATGGCGAPSDNQEECKPHQVYAQGMWAPPGAVVRDQPDRAAHQVGTLKANQAIQVDYWFHSGTPVYPQNQPPYNSDVWLHMAEAGSVNEWVNFAAVRAGQVALENYDPTGLKPDVGGPVDLKVECEIKGVTPGVSPSLPVLK